MAERHVIKIAAIVRDFSEFRVQNSLFHILLNRLYRSPHYLNIVTYDTVTTEVAHPLIRTVVMVTFIPPLSGDSYSTQ